MALQEKYPVYVANVEDYDDALTMISDLGKVTERQAQANQLVASIEREFAAIPFTENNKVAYVIWRKPYMVAGRDTFIQAMLEKCGFINVFQDRPERYPEVTLDDFRQAKPDMVFLSSEPFPFQESHQREFEKQYTAGKAILVDGELFSWYGSRMLQAPDYFRSLLTKLKS